MAQVYMEAINFNCVKSNQQLALESLAQVFNSVTTLFNRVGMIPVDTATYPQQLFEKFSIDQSLVDSNYLDSTRFVSTHTNYYMGDVVYRHPTMGIHIVVRFGFRSGSNMYTIAPLIQYRVFLDFEQDKTIGSQHPLISPITIEDGSGSHLVSSAVPYTNAQSLCRAYCSDDMFWIGGAVSSPYTNNQTGLYSDYFNFIGVNGLTLIVQKVGTDVVILTNQSATVMLSTLFVGATSTSDSPYNGYGYTPQRWDLISGKAVFTGNAQAFSFLPDYNNGMSADGVRVARATYYSVNGIKRSLNIGTANAGAAIAENVIGVDLLGDGVRPYYVCNSISPCCIVRGGAPRGSIPNEKYINILLPWEV